MGRRAECGVVWTVYEDERGSTIRLAIDIREHRCAFREFNIPSIARRGYIEIDYTQDCNFGRKGGNS